MNMSTLIAKSNSRLMTVTFVKADGTLRTMYAKTNIKRHLTKTKKRSTPKQNDSLVRLFDVEKKQYRSIKLDSIKSYRCGNVIVQGELI